MSSQYPFTTPPHAVGAPMLSPLRRQNAAQPPALRTTSLNNAQGLGLGYGLNAGQTPVSTTSLSSPFAVHSASPYPASSAVAASPMALRSPATFSAPYNPQQWGRIGSDGSPSLGSASTLSPLHARQSSRAVNYAPRLRGPDGEKVSGLSKVSLLIAVHRTNVIPSTTVLSRCRRSFICRHNLSFDRLLQRNHSEQRNNNNVS